MRKTHYLAMILSMFLATTAWSQELAKRVTNQDIVDMVGLGLSEDVIIAKIRSTSPDALKFDTSVDGLKALKTAKVPDSVIKVMINPAPPPAPVIAASTAISLDPNLPPPEVGVYWKDGANFIFIEGQAISHEKAGGRAASYFTYGMRGQHWDATLNGPTSNNRLKDRRPQFYLYVPDGTSAADFVLIKLQKKSDRREFQVGSFGGVGGGKSGVKRDVQIPYTSEHVAIRTYKITLGNDLKPGEYAFFMGTGNQADMSAGRVSSSSGGNAGGRVYDFTIPE